jgi:ABC-type transporter lipoprotein component MlaA
VSLSRKVIAAVGLVVLGAAIAVAVVLLRTQGLDQAGQWVTVLGFFVSTVLGVAGLADLAAEQQAHGG